MNATQKANVIYIDNSTDENYPAASMMLVDWDTSHGTRTTVWTETGSYEQVELGEFEFHNEEHLRQQVNEVILGMRL